MQKDISKNPLYNSKLQETAHLPSIRGTIQRTKEYLEAAKRGRNQFLTWKDSPKLVGKSKFQSELYKVVFHLSYF